MKCSNCDKQWDIFGSSKEQLAECPFCHNKITANYKNFSSVSESIYYAITVGSKEKSDILANKQRLWGFLSDTIDPNSPESNIVKSAVNSNVGKLLYDAMDGSGADKQTAVDSAVSQLNREFGMDKTKAYEVVGFFTKAMGWNMTVSAPSPAPAAAPQAQQTATQTVPGNATMNAAPASNATFVQPQNNAVMQQPQSNTVASPMKKSKVGLVVALIAVLVAAGAVIAVISNSKQEIPVSVPEITTSAPETTATVSETEAVEAVAEVTTEAATTTTAAEVTSSAEISEEDSRWRLTDETTTASETDEEAEFAEETPTEETSAESEESAEQSEESEKATEMSALDSYVIRNLILASADIYTSRNLYYDYEYASFDWHRMCINPSTNKLYYIDDETSLYSVDLNDGSKELIKEYSAFKKHDNYDLYGATLQYNPYNKTVYLFLHYGTFSLYADVNSDEAIKIETTGRAQSFSFTDENKLAVYRDYDSSGALNVSEYDMMTQKTVDGYVCYLKNFSRDRISSIQPFIYDDDFYWLERYYGNNSKKSASIVHTRNSIRNAGKDCGDIILEEIRDIIYSTVYNDEVYIMSKDFSIYKVKLETLLSTQGSDSSSDNGVITFSSSSDNNESSYELVLDGSKIKQTGRTNLNTITCFDVVGDGRFVVYDDFDKTYKIIEAQ